MQIGSFIERCPHCFKIMDTYSAWRSNDYKTEFSVECSNCEKTVYVIAHCVPEFEHFKEEV